jgi:hypothetical protein
MDRRLEETKQLLQELEKQAKETASFLASLASYENSIYVDLVKQHTARAVKEIEIALSFLSLTED